MNTELWPEQQSPAKHPSNAPRLLVILGLLLSMSTLLPVVYLALRALGDGGDWSFLHSPRIFHIFINTILLVLIVSAGCGVIGVSLAWLTVRTTLPFRRLITILTALPFVIPSYIAGFLFATAFAPQGVIQGLVEPIGITELPGMSGLIGASFTLILVSYPYVLLPVRVSLSRIDPAIEDAARGLGLGPWRTFFQVTLPSVRPSIMAGTLLVALYTISDFGAVSLMRFETFTWAIFIHYESGINIVMASRLSLFLIGLALVLLLIDSSSKRNVPYYRVTPGSPKPSSNLGLNRWVIPALIYCGLLISCGLLLPVGILAHWLTQGISSSQSLGDLWVPAWQSLYISALAAIISMTCSIPIAILSVRYPNKVSMLIERSTYLGFAIPGISVALGIVFFSINFMTPIYQTTVLLLFAYTVLFVPAAIAATKSALLSVNPRLEDAARGLGKNRTQVFRMVTLPLMWRGTLAGGVLVFLLTMKELPATLILSPLGFKTLATTIWGSASEAFFTQAAFASLLLLLVTSIPMAFLTFHGQRELR